ncbi:MAG TPA: hypothetical protein VN701_00395 [Candidatus Paceibacterota bacterium]|nr:hypothetical protein [Candidatus Paceibacterota bacterium]
MSILAVAGASGVGKSTFTRLLLQTVPNATLITSHTTRALRGDEIEWKGVSQYEQKSREEMLRLEDEGAYLKLFGEEYKTLYATLVSLFERALHSPSLHVCELFVPGVELFFDEARKRGLEWEMHAAFLDLKSEDERTRRLNQGGGRDETRYDPQLERFRRLVERSSEPFFWLDASEPTETLVHKTINKFGFLAEA